MGKSTAVPFYEGMICQADDVPDFDVASRRIPRPVLIIYPPPYTPPPLQAFLLAVGISSSPSQAKVKSGRLVQLPDTTRFPSTTSGLDEPSWANPDWLLKIHACRILYKRGFVDADFHAGAVKRRLTQEVQTRAPRIICLPGTSTCPYCRSGTGLAVPIPN